MDKDPPEHDAIMLTSDNNHSPLVPLILRPYTSKQKHQLVQQKHNDFDGFKTSLNRIHRLIEKNELRYNQKHYNTVIGQEWQILGRVVDRLLVYIFLICTMLVFLFIFLQAPRLRLK